MKKREGQKKHSRNVLTVTRKEKETFKECLYFILAFRLLTQLTDFISVC